MFLLIRLVDSGFGVGLRLWGWVNRPLVRHFDQVRCSGVVVFGLGLGPGAGLEK